MLTAQCTERCVWVWLQANVSSARKLMEEETVCLPDVGMDMKLDPVRHRAVLIFRCEAQKSLEPLLRSMRNIASYPAHAHTIDGEVISGSAEHSQESAQHR